MLTNSPQVNKKSIQGFSLPEVLVVVLILSIVTLLSLMGIAKAQTSFQLSNGADILKVYLEKAFSDAKRRHAQGNSRSKIQVVSTTTYQVTIDFNGDGVVETNTISLPKKVYFLYSPANPPIATIDWRGNVAEGNVTFNLSSDQNETLALELTSHGDSNIRSEYPTLPTVSNTTISSDVSLRTVLAGNSAPNLNPSPTPSPSPLPYCAGNQKPEIDNCRCKTGKTIDSKGKCG